MAEAEWPGDVARGERAASVGPGPVDGVAGRVDPPTEDWEKAAEDEPPAGAGGWPPGPPPGPPPGGPWNRPPNRAPGGAPNRGPGRKPGRRRSLWWPRGAIVVGCAVVVGLAIGVITALQGGGSQKASGAADTTTAGAGTPAAALPAIIAPGCRSTVAPARTLGNVRAQSVAVGGHPFGVATTADGKFTFVPNGDSIVVLASTGGLAPAVAHVISAPGVHNGAVLTHNGKYLVAALNSGAVVVDVAAAEQGSSHAIVGTLTSSFGSGAVEVAISPDDRFVFVTLQDSAAMAVFNLRTALDHGFGRSAVVGKVSLGQQPVGLVFSPGARWLYATSMTKAVTQNAAEGTVSVIDTALAETNPAKAVKATADAGCDPVRVIASGDGQTVWVTSRESDALLGFSASRLISNPGKALETQVDVGAAPIGETFARSGSQTRILVADSNVRQQSGVAPSVAVIDPAKALRRVPALLGYVSTGELPRQFTIQPDGKTALVTNNGSGQLQAIDLATLP
jgi:DNA-binding beta-propeller fold protein YncE